MKPELSIVIPAHNRVELLKRTFDNCIKASEGIDTEIILVDDRSEPLLEECLGEIPSNVRIILGDGCGSARARCRGICESIGQFVFLTDSDDEVSLNKFHSHLEVMRKEKIEVTYSDQGDRFSSKPDHLRPPLPDDLSLPALLIGQDLVSNNLVYKGDWLRKDLPRRELSPRSTYGPAGDYWVYYNLLFKKGRTRKNENAISYHCHHDENQETGCWEKLGFSSQYLIDEMVDHQDLFAYPEETKRLLSKAIFQSWRKLPPDYMSSFSDAKMKTWKKLPQLPDHEYGGKSFILLANILGLKSAGKILRYFQRPRYARVATLARGELLALEKTMAATNLKESNIE